MTDLAESLNTRLNLAVQSTSDRDFYQCLYHYFDFIEKTPELKKIFEDSEKDYSEKHGKRWEKRPMTDDEAEEAESQTIKLERFNLYAVGCTIYVRIYLPIDDYKNTDAPDNKQDPVALLLVRGMDYTVKLKKWSEKTLKIYNKWFDGKRNLYESELKRFHVMLLDELAKPKPRTTSKPEIIFDKENSILKIDDKEVHIKLKNDLPNSHYVLEYVFTNEDGLKEKSFYSDILESKFPAEKMDWRSIYRACNDINKKVSEQANINKFFIVKTGKTGYAQINSDYL